MHGWYIKLSFTDIKIESDKYKYINIYITYIYIKTWFDLRAHAPIRGGRQIEYNNSFQLNCRSNNFRATIKCARACALRWLAMHNFRTSILITSWFLLSHDRSWAKRVIYNIRILSSKHPANSLTSAIHSLSELRHTLQLWTFRFPLQSNPPCSPAYTYRVHRRSSTWIPSIPRSIFADVSRLLPFRSDRK